MDLWFDLRTQKLSEVLQDPRAKGAGDVRLRTSGWGPRAKGAGDARPRASGKGSPGEGGRGRAPAGVGEGSPGGRPPRPLNAKEHAHSSAFRVLP
jgi:hypothetical protein